ncbi:hypothetical protein NLI96_g11202 [Meripilus lineatus]|uniref:Retrotransposon gag domain-containing protein n=1 Tax=Meripilus lineatus TaxID=2056292 RepID=A0AAD5Y9C8_9APHY|nr:hypothetical protein NLI96_g11202 [Physisporinus lineatus]
MGLSRTSPTMTPQDRDKVVFDAVCALGRSCEQSVIFSQTVIQLVQELSAQRNKDREPKASLPRVREPVVFNGKADKVVPWVRDIRAIVSLHAAGFTSEYQKVLWASLFLGEGTPISWFNLLKIRKATDLNSPLYDFERFLGAFKECFQNKALVDKKTREINSLVQTGSYASYTSRFAEILAYLDISEETMFIYYRKGLKPDLLKALAYNSNKPTQFEAFTELAIEIDEDLWSVEQDIKEHERERRYQHRTHNPHPGCRPHPAPYHPPPPPPVPFPAHHPQPSTSHDVVPMEVDAVRCGPLTEAKKQRRRDLGLCLYCGGANHFAGICPNKSSKARAFAKASPRMGKAR